jgi:hypothetical protein
MPIYNEPLPSLMAAINSVAHTKYPLDKIEMLLAFDEKKQTDLYIGTMYCLTRHSKSPQVIEQPCCLSLGYGHEYERISKPLWKDLGIDIDANKKTQ